MTIKTTTNNSKKKKLLKTAMYASHVMGRHVVDHDHGNVIVDWPGVRLDFDGPFHNTTSISIRMNGKGATFGYRLVPIVEEEDKGGEDDSANNNNNNDDALAFVTSRQNKMKDYLLLLPTTIMDNNTNTNTTTTNTSLLDPTKKYKLSMWKQGDPAGGGSIIAGLVVDDTCIVPTTLPESPCSSPLPAAGCSSTSKKLIEFVGDSNTVGYGITGPKSGFLYHVLWEGIGLQCFNSPHRLVKTTDTTKSWAARVANSLKADYNIIAWSGIGAGHSAWGGSNRTMIRAYGRLLASDPKSHVTPEEQLPGRQPDAVIIMIGQNDTVNTITNPTRLYKSFTNLLKEIRKYRPAPIPIIVVVPTPETQIACVMTQKETKKKAKWLNQVWKSVIVDWDDDECIHLIKNNHDPPLQPHNTTTQKSAEDYGMFLHWNENANEKWSKPLIPKVQELLRWNN